MSLLMDALKKAEQEKKEAARRLKETQEKSGGHYKLDDAGTTDAEEKPVVDPEDETEVHSLELEEPRGTADDLPGSGESPADKEDQTLSSGSPDPVTEPTLAGSRELSLEPVDDDTLEHPEISDEDNDFEEDVKQAGNDQTFAIPPLSLEEELASPFESSTKQTLYDDTRADTISDTRASRSFISAEALAKDMGSGHEVPTPVAARTVFTAVARSSERRQFMEWMVFLSLVTAIIMAVGTFYYLKVTPLTPETSSPLVAKGIEHGTEQPLDIDLPEPAAETADSGQIDAIESITPATDTTMAETEQESATALVTADEAMTTPETAQAGGVEAAMPAGDVAAVEEEVTVKSGAPETKVVEAAETPVASMPVSLPEHISVDPSAIAISRSRSVSRQDQLINSAFTAYSRGDYAAAEKDYRQALAAHPGNRDAMLGMAAVAYRQGNLQSAFEYYLQVLKHFPRDTAARAALINLQGATNPVRSVSTLKSLIDNDPQADYLYFILGNIYAGSARWADAQQVFFEAHRLQPQNPDYAYNLAVSLDHLGKHEAAIDFYNTALKLSDSQQTGFDTGAASRRISSLSVNQTGR